MRLIDVQPVLDYSHNKNIRACTVDLLEALPVVDAVPVVRGEWVGVAHGRGGHECSKCRGYAPSFQNGAEYLSSYCPKCGAKMEDKSCG